MWLIEIAKPLIKIDYNYKLLLIRYYSIKIHVTGGILTNQPFPSK